MGGNDTQPSFGSIRSLDFRGCTRTASPTSEGIQQIRSRGTCAHRLFKGRSCTPLFHTNQPTSWKNRELNGNRSRAMVQSRTQPRCCHGTQRHGLVLFCVIRRPLVSDVKRLGRVFSSHAPECRAIETFCHLPGMTQNTEFSLTRRVERTERRQAIGTLYLLGGLAGQTGFTALKEQLGSHCACLTAREGLKVQSESAGLDREQGDGVGAQNRAVSTGILHSL
jgi:hypothetical protein